MTKKSNKKYFALLFIAAITVIAFVCSSTNVFAEDGKGKLIFDSAGGSNVDDKEFTCGEKIGNLPKPTREGYSFEHWKTDSGTIISKDDVLECGDIKVTAEWTSGDCNSYCKACREWFGKNSLDELYGIEIKQAGGKITVKMSGRANGWTEFKVTKIEFFNVDDAWNDTTKRKSFATEGSMTSDLGVSSFVLSKDKTFTFTPHEEEPTRMRIHLDPSKGVDASLKSICGDSLNDVTIHVVYDYSGEPIEHDSQLNLKLPTPSQGSTGIIDCSKVRETEDPETFEEAYCRDTRKAEAFLKATGGKPYTFDGSASTFSAKKYATPNFTCDAKSILEDDTIEYKDYYDGDHNRSYMIGTMSFEKNAGNYMRNYSAHVKEPEACIKYLNDHQTEIEAGTLTYAQLQNCPKKDKNGKCILSSAGPCYIIKNEGNSKTFQTTEQGEAIKCKITCKEIVTVEYGRPVASKAGLCFDYKVKVTSRVNCHSDLPNAPAMQVKYCTPSPGCNHGKGYVDPAAGPSEEFDSCVLKCDGGKYSTKCSSECYNKVYNRGTNALSKTADYGLADFVATPLDTHGNDTIDRAENANKCQGYYYRTGDDVNDPVIKWAPQDVYGRWYCEKNKSMAHACLKTTAQGGGISSVCGCSAKCRWNDCKKGVYINPAVSEVDDVQNREIYNSAIKACEGYSRCSETQATFNFQVDYTDDSGKKTTITLPYDNNKPDSVDTIKYSHDARSVMCTSESNKLNTTIIQSKGCYQCAEKDSENDQSGSSNNWYLTEWTFPGTWIHNKTGEISYSPKSGSSWDKYAGKFCLPKNTANVNQEWYNAYIVAKYSKKTEYSYFSESTSTDDKTCRVTNCKKYEKGSKESSFPDEALGDIDWNIRAHARSFGLFGWNIDISCFYATNDAFPTYKSEHRSGETCNHSGGCIPSYSTRVRSVDLANIFPSVDGEKLSSPDTTGRADLPFNWSQYASNTKTENYHSQPTDYTAWLQATNYKIYEGEEYLDYEVNLTKDLIRDLRKNKDRNYTEFQGEEVAGSIYQYKSPLFRGTKAGEVDLRSSSRFPSESVLGCNNIRNYNSTSCENIHGEGE